MLEGEGVRILHLCWGLEPTNGAATIARHLMDEQRAEGHEVRLASVYTRAEIESCDQLWCHCGWYWRIWLAVAWAKRLGKTVVWLPEGCYDPVRLAYHGWKKRLAGPFERRALRRADLLLATCEAEAEWIRAYLGGNHPSVEVTDIRRFFRFPCFSRLGTSGSPCYSRLGTSGSPCPTIPPFHLLYLGREHPLKGVRCLQEAVKRVGGVELRIVSDHHGEELERDWAWCDVLCLPTLSDNFGLVVAEALARGKKVIVTDGAPAWKNQPGVVYVRGYRAADETRRVRLLVEALLRLRGTPVERTVWIVNPFDNLPAEGARPQRYWMMSEAFVRAGWRVVYWTSDFSHATKAARALASGCESFSSEGIDVRMIPTRPYAKNVGVARLASHRRLARDFRALVGRELSGEGRPPDLIVASAPPLGLCSAALEAARACGAAFVCDVQDAWPETFLRLLPRGFRWLGRLLFAPMFRLARRIYRSADRVTGVCRRYAALTGRADYYLAPLGFVGASTELSAPKTSFRRLVYIGNLGVGYDLETVFKAMAERTDLTLDIAGRGPREDKLKRRAAKLGLAGRVRFHGFLDSDALKRLLADCDVGVIPMSDDSWVGLPNKLADYLAAGLSVVSSLDGECGELLRKTGFGQTYAERSPGSFVEALTRLQSVSVSLPDELRAEGVYERYVFAAEDPFLLALGWAK